jgi:hypothetical protein
LLLIEAPPQLLDLRPRKNNWFGRRPLVSATIFSPYSPGGLGGGMTVDGQKVEASLEGAQLLYLLPEGALGDGTHKIQLQGSNGYGNAVEQALDFYVDKVPPKVEVEPKDDQPVKGPRPVWTLTCSDSGSGFDDDSLAVQILSQGEGATPVRATIIQQGLYKCELPGLNVKMNDHVPTTGKIQVSADRDLTPGVYQLKITACDKAGNRKEETRTYRVSE